MEISSEQLKKLYITHFILWLNDYSHHRKVNRDDEIAYIVHLSNGVYIRTPEGFVPRSNKWSKYVIEQILSRNGPLYGFYELYVDTIRDLYKKYENSNGCYTQHTSGIDYEDDVLSLSTVYRNNEGVQLCINTTGEYTEQDAANRNYMKLMNNVFSNLNKEVYETDELLSLSSNHQIYDFYKNHIQNVKIDESDYDITISVKCEHTFYERTFYSMDYNIKMVKLYAMIVFREIMTLSETTNLSKTVPAQKEVHIDYKLLKFIKSIFTLRRKK